MGKSMGARKHTRTHTHTHKYKRQIQAPKQSRNFFIAQILWVFVLSFTSCSEREMLLSNWSLHCERRCFFVLTKSLRYYRCQFVRVKSVKVCSRAPQKKKKDEYSEIKTKNRTSTFVKYTRTNSRLYCGSKHLNGLAIFSWITWTCALMTKVSATVNPSKTLPSSINFFHPQSCSFLQNRCKVSEYFDFFGSLFTTAMVNCAKWLHPGNNLS